MNSGGHRGRRLVSDACQDRGLCCDDRKTGATTGRELARDPPAASSSRIASAESLHGADDGRRMQGPAWTPVRSYEINRPVAADHAVHVGARRPTCHSMCAVGPESRLPPVVAYRVVRNAGRPPCGYCARPSRPWAHRPHRNQADRHRSSPPGSSAAGRAMRIRRTHVHAHMP